MYILKNYQPHVCRNCEEAGGHGENFLIVSESPAKTITIKRHCRF